MTLMLWALGPTAADAVESTCEADEPVELVEPVELCGTTTLTGLNAGVIRVRLPRAASISSSISFGPGQDIAIEGSGLFTGMALIEDRPERDGVGLVVGRLPADAPVRDQRLLMGVSCSGAACTIPAGEYLLFLLVDRSPATVTLRFGGLRGSVDLSPARPAPFAVRAPEVRMTQPTQNVYWAGDSADLEGLGMSFMSTWTIAETALVRTQGLCMYQGEPSGPLSYAPGCDGALYTFTGLSTNQVNHWVPRLAAGRYGQGAWQNTVGVVKRIRSVVFLLTLSG